MIIDTNCIIFKEYTVNDLLKEMDKAGIDKAAVSLLPHSELYEDLVEGIRNNPGRLYGIYDVNPYDRDIEGKIIKAFNEGFVGIRLNPLAYGFALDNMELLSPVLDICQKWEKGVWVYSTADVFCCPVLLKKAAERYPDVNFILGFMGFNYESNGAITIAQKYPNVYLDCTCAMYANLSGAISKTDGKKAVFGSGAGYASFAEIELKKIKQLKLSADVEQNFLYGNAVKIFGLQEGSL